MIKLPVISDLDKNYSPSSGQVREYFVSDVVAHFTVKTTLGFRVTYKYSKSPTDIT